MAPSGTIKVDLKRTVSIPLGKGEIANLKAGTQDVEKRVVDHWLFQALVKDGEITVVMDKPTAAPPTPDEIQKAVEGALLVAHERWGKEQNDLIDLLKADFEKEKAQAVEAAVAEALEKTKKK
jgi:hypothetical protein